MKNAELLAIWLWAVGVMAAEVARGVIIPLKANEAR
jgi:hypothetical protein